MEGSIARIKDWCDRIGIDIADSLKAWIWIHDEATHGEQEFWLGSVES